MKDAQKPDHISLTTLINRLREGRFVIPDFQREFEWDPGDIRELMRSVFLDYYIGSLLLWRGKQESFEALACEPIYGYQGNGAPQDIVLDGQQRLTALYYAFCAPDVPAPKRANRFLFFLRVDRFMEGAHDEAFFYDWSRKGVNLIENDEAQFEQHIFPLSVVGKTGWALPTWVQGYASYWEKKAAAAEQEGNTSEVEGCRRHVHNAKAFELHIRGITEEYQIAFIELDRDIEIDKVCDIFTQINSRGIRLDIFDLINALLKPKGLQLKHMWREAEDRLAFVDSDRLNVYLLQIMSIIRQNYCSPKYLYYLLPGQRRAIRGADGSLRHEVLVPDTNDFQRRWDQAVSSLEAAIELLRHPQEFGAISSSYLPYVSILPAFAALQAHTSTLQSERQLVAQRKIRQWYWASVFTNRYSGAVESTSAGDFIAVKEWIENDDAKPESVYEFHSRFRSLDLLRETRRGTSIYNGIFNLFVLNEARDWRTGNAPRYADLDDHHIVPKSWGAGNGHGSSIDTILNRTPLTSETNREVIRDRLPNEYLREMIDANGESMVEDVLASHFVSRAALDILLRDPFSSKDYEEFILERRHSLIDAIEDLLIKERSDIPRDLKEWDARTEGIELALRRFIVDGLNGDPSLLPSHVSQKISERLQTAARRNPAHDSDYYRSLAGQLEFCDLRELEGVLANRGLRGIFGAQFDNTNTLGVRFGQLGELRNAIRHSRTVDELTCKDGEAAIAWFEAVLKS